jgi:hypothetical protein
MTLTLLLALPVIGYSAIVYVPGDYPTIQQAINAVANGDIVRVEPGTYVENIDLAGKAITVESTGGALVTVIDGNQAGRVVLANKSEGTSTVLDGFTITNGKSAQGAGMLIRGSSPSVKNCVFYDNTAYDTSIYGSGGGIYCDKNSSPSVYDCYFIDNHAIQNGGGMVNNSLGVPTVTRCIFLNNSAENNGGGMDNTSKPVVTDCIFRNNTSLEFGGGMVNSSGSSTVTNCIFVGNESNEGGGMYNSFYCTPTITNCAFYGNEAVTTGGGMNNGFGSDATVVNCSFSGNVAVNGGGISLTYCSTTVVNSILWGDVAGSGPELWLGNASFPSTLDISYCDVEGGMAAVYVDSGCTLNWGTNMMDTDPFFVYTPTGDLHLTYTSPCKDAGDDSVVVESTDFDGDPRILGDAVEMGADEFHKRFYCSGDFSPGGSIAGTLLDTPGTSPTAILLGAGLLDPPAMTPWGLFYLQSPWLMIMLVPIPANGALVLPATLPGTPPAPYDIPMQAMFGAGPDALTDVFVMEVR